MTSEQRRRCDSGLVGGMSQGTEVTSTAPTSRASASLSGVPPAVIRVAYHLTTTLNAKHAKVAKRISRI